MSANINDINFNSKIGAKVMSIDTPSRPINSGHEGEPTNINYTENSDSAKLQEHKSSKKLNRRRVIGLLAAGGAILASGVVGAKALSNEHDNPQPTKPKATASAPAIPGPEASQAPYGDMNKLLAKYNQDALLSTYSRQRAEYMGPAIIAAGHQNYLVDTPKTEKDLLGASEVAFTEITDMIDLSASSGNNLALTAFVGPNIGLPLSMSTRLSAEAIQGNTKPTSASTCLAYEYDAQSRPVVDYVDDQTIDRVLVFNPSNQDPVYMAIELKFYPNPDAPGKSTPIVAAWTMANREPATLNPDPNFDPFQNLKSNREPKN